MSEVVSFLWVELNSYFVKVSSQTGFETQLYRSLSTDDGLSKEHLLGSTTVVNIDKEKTGGLPV